MEGVERVSTAVWLETNKESLDRVTNLKEQMLGVTVLAEEVVANTRTPEIQDDTIAYLAESQLRLFPELVAAHRAIPYDELQTRQEEANWRLSNVIGELALVESGAFEEAQIVHRDAAWVAGRFPELGEHLAGTVARAIARQQQEQRERLDREHQAASADLEQLNATTEAVGFIPLPVLATHEQQREAYRTARAIMANEEPPPDRESLDTQPEAAAWERGPGWRAGGYLARHAGERLALADVAQATYGPEDERATAKLNALLSISLTSARSPLKDRLTETGLTLRFEKEPLESSGRRRYRYFVGAFPNEPEPAK